MTFDLDEVVPWGRSFDEYCAMFALSNNDLNKWILGCADGPAAFNSVLSKRGGAIISVDPLYQYSAEAIRGRIEKTFDDVVIQTRKNQHEFVWKQYQSVDELGWVRQEAMSDFLADYPAGKIQGRYVAASLPALPFADGLFELALCSHFLFLYSKHLGRAFHIRSLKELCRVAEEVRVFPLLELGAKKSRHLQPVIDHLMREGITVEIRMVAYEFQRGGNQMLVLKSV